MSRSNPTAASNPATRFYEWSGSKGILKYYDKATEQQVEVKLPFTFMVLDELATVKGWHDPSSSGIFSNEVRRTTEEKLTVKAYKGGIIAEGIYATIKEKIVAAGGKFTTNIYIAYKNDAGKLSIGALQFKGAGLQAWSEFKRANKVAIDTKAIIITGANDGKKGSVKFKTPIFESNDISEATNLEALGLDIELQAYLMNYFKKPATEQVKAHEEAAPVQVSEDDACDTTFEPTNKMPF